MYVEFFLKPIVCFSPDDPAAPPADPPADPATPPADPPPDPAMPPADPPADPPAAKWWEGEKFKEHRELLEAKGLTLDDKDDVIAQLAKSEKAAQVKLGKPADQLLTKPGKDESITDWMKANGEMFGIPESAEKYEITKPDAWPKDAAWDSDLETKLREVGHARGISGEAMNDLVGLYAEKMMALDASSAQDLADANAAMMKDLEKDWGAQTQAKLTLAGQAASVIAEKAGLDATAMENLAASLKPKIGDAGTMRIFAAIGEMMGDDQMVMGNGATSLSTTPAEARAELAQLQAQGGAYYKAVQERNQAEIARLKPQIERLTRIAAG